MPTIVQGPQGEGDLAEQIQEDVAEYLDSHPNLLGLQGPQGTPGVSRRAQWSGFGPPDLNGNVVIGATPGDSYEDLLTGDIYTLS